MSSFRARWLLPIDRPPIEHGWIQIAGHRIVAVGAGRAPSDAQDLGDVALLPGLVNAHTHLELSWMAGMVPPAGSMHEWIGSMMPMRRAGLPGGADAELAAAHAAAAEMRATGTVLVGDISNTLTAVPSLLGAGLEGRLFHELLGFAVTAAAAAVTAAERRLEELRQTHATADVDFAMAAHAPYSTSPALFREIARRQPRRLSIHLAESPEEVEFLRTGRGPIRGMLEKLGVWTDEWVAPGCDPVEYLDRVGYLQPGLLVAHGVHLRRDAIDRLRDAQAVIVTCPRSNEWVGAGLPPVAYFYASGVRVAIGTDSLASVSSLNLFDELAGLRRIAPEVAAGKLLESATRTGAEALGRGADFGTLAAGKRATFVLVDVPAGERDVEEYLVSGVARERIHPVPVPC